MEATISAISKLTTTAASLAFCAAFMLLVVPFFIVVLACSVSSIDAMSRDKADTVKSKSTKRRKIPDLRTQLQKSDEKNNPNKENNTTDHDNKAKKDSVIIKKSAFYETLKKATDNCDPEKIGYWHELVNRLEEEYKKYRAVCDEELRKAREAHEEELKKKKEELEEKLRMKKSILEGKYDEDRRNWERERKILKANYEKMRWT